MRRARNVFLAGGAVVVLALVFHQALLAAVGSYLVRTGTPEKADIVIVLAGDGKGRRILGGADLVRQGFAPHVLVSGPGSSYGLHECDLAIQFAVHAGYPQQYFIPMVHDGHSTRDEAEIAAPLLREMGVHTALLVTSDYHTRRAGAVFRDVTPDIRYVVVAVPDEFFSVDGWWHNREGRKTALLEWTKTVANWFRL